MTPYTHNNNSRNLIAIIDALTNTISDLSAVLSKQIIIIESNAINMESNIETIETYSKIIEALSEIHDRHCFAINSAVLNIAKRELNSYNQLK